MSLIRKIKCLSKDLCNFEKSHVPTYVVDVLPPTLQPNSIYFEENSKTVYVTDESGLAVPYGGKDKFVIQASYQVRIKNGKDTIPELNNGFFYYRPAYRYSFPGLKKIASNTLAAVNIPGGFKLSRTLISMRYDRNTKPWDFFIGRRNFPFGINPKDTYSSDAEFLDIITFQPAMGNSYNFEKIYDNSSITKPGDSIAIAWALHDDDGSTYEKTIYDFNLTLIFEKV